MENFKFKTQKGISINAYKWIPTGEIKAIIQISHGMDEHIKRYDEFGEFLSGKGYLVYGNDHLGHGDSLLEGDQLGYISDDNGFDDMVDEMKMLTDMIKSKNKDLKLFIFAHSMGSFVAQRYVQLYGEEIDGLILSGTNGKPPRGINAGIFISDLIIKTSGRRKKSKLINVLSFGSYNKRIKGRRTIFDWLSRDDKEVDKYIEDPLCGNLFPVSFFHDLYIGMKDVHIQGNLENIPKDLPIYIFAGSEDPVGLYGRGIVNLHNIYKRLEIKDVEYKIYDGGRHEMLNEINRLEVMIDVLNWLEFKGNK